MKPAELENLIKVMGFLNSEAFARELEVHPATVYRWRNGEVPIPERTARLIRMLYLERTPGKEKAEH